MKSGNERDDSGTAGGDEAPGGGPAAPTLAALPPPGPRTLGLLLLNAVFAVIAFGPLITFEPEPLLEAELEGVFFTPADTSPTIVLLLSAWLLYRRWPRIRRLPLEPGSRWLSGGLLLLAAAILGWSVYTGARDLRVLAVISALMGSGCLLGGTRAMSALLTPSFFLLFAIPMPAPLLNVLLTQMQLATAELTGAILHLFGESAFVSGDQILREGNDFAIIETCAGVRITETLTMLTILMLDLFRRSRLHGAILLALAPAVAFACNGGRAVTLILNPHSTISEIHSLQGIAMLLVGLLLLYGIDGVLGWALGERAHSARRFSAGAAAGGEAGFGPVRRRVALLTGVMAAYAAIALALPAWPQPPHRTPPGLIHEFLRVGDWESEALPVDARFLGRIGSQREVHRRFRRGDESVDLFVALGRREDRPRSVLFSKAEYPGSGWNTEDDGWLRLDPGGITARWRTAVKGPRKYLVVSWHEEGAGLVAESLRSFLALDRSPFRRPGESLVIRMSTRLLDFGSEHRPRGEDRLLRFYSELRPVLDDLRGNLHQDTA